MEVILLENIKKLGQIGDNVKVKRGYARNYLIKFGKALVCLTHFTDYEWIQEFLSIEDTKYGV